MKSKQTEKPQIYPAQNLELRTVASTTDDRSTAFRAVDNTKESVAGGPLLLAAYAVLWLIVLGLIMRIFQRQNKLVKSIDTLQRNLDRRFASGELRSEIKHGTTFE